MGDEAWTVDEPKWEGTDLTYVAAHELGHALGLEHDRYDSRSIMYASYKYVDTRDIASQFSNNDIYYIQNLYGPRRTQHNKPYSDPRKHVSTVPGHGEYSNRRDRHRKRVKSHRKVLCEADAYDAAGFYGDQFWVFYR